MLCVCGWVSVHVQYFRMVETLVCWCDTKMKLTASRTWARHCSIYFYVDSKFCGLCRRVSPWDTPVPVVDVLDTVMLSRDWWRAYVAAPKLWRPGQGHIRVSLFKVPIEIWFNSNTTLRVWKLWSRVTFHHLSDGPGIWKGEDRGNHGHRDREVDKSNGRLHFGRK